MQEIFNGDLKLAYKIINQQNILVEKRKKRSEELNIMIQRIVKSKRK